MQSRGSDIRATAGDLWHLGSNTKPITALLIALLIDQGLLDWDTPLAQIFPEHVAEWNADVKKITPAHLLTHTSGLPAVGPIDWKEFYGSSLSPLQDRERVVKSLAKVQLTAKPGKKYAYSNLGYVVLGAIADRRGKAAWEEQLQTKIFQPLGIKHGGLGPAGNIKEVTQPWPHSADGAPLDANADNPPVMNSAGRVHMPVADYNRFLAETLKMARGEKGLLKAAAAQKTFTNPYPTSPFSLSGWQGFRKEAGAKGLILAHEGSNGFNHCIAVVVPDQHRALCVFTNQGGPGGPGEAVCHELLKEL